ncbi:hypothetical protein HK103_006299 [Boothiomyces macroporosus]|uniref:Uncharacterized protein n=1 Tax=Boothiomyces macroporosus TaxID=261099 RepID=A0AAD5UDY5_9FUNG|nr:hypothetical protein HK103_006299 [Boothiomyces macroporosus]
MMIVDKTQKKLEAAVEDWTKAKELWASYATTLFNKIETMESDRCNSIKKIFQKYATLVETEFINSAKNANELSVAMNNLETEEYIYGVCQAKGNKEGRDQAIYERKNDTQNGDAALKQSEQISSKLEKLPIDADGHSIATPHKPNYSVTGSLTPSNAAVVDAEGYTIKPHNDNDLFKANFGDDEDFQ